MPHLTVSHNAIGKDQDGNDVTIPHHAALAQSGPRIQVTISLATQLAADMQSRGEDIPAPETGWAIIDTGASVTCIDEELATKMGLPVIDQLAMASASHDKTMQNVYPVTLELQGLPMGVDAPRAVGAALKAQGIVALIGRDVLQHCTLYYNGPAGQITLSI